MPGRRHEGPPLDPARGGTTPLGRASGRPGRGRSPARRSEIDLPRIVGSIGYTGGTTGRPKGALRRAVDPHYVATVCKAFDLDDPDHVHLVAGPLYHAAPGAFARFAQLYGNTIVVMPRFDAEEALRLIERHRCTTTFMAPTLLKRIVDLPDEVRARYDVSSMRVIVMMAAPCPMSIKERVLALLRPGPVRVVRLDRARHQHDPTARGRPAQAGLLRASPGWRRDRDPGRGRGAGPGRHARRAARAPVGQHPRGVLQAAGRDARMSRGDWLSVGDVAYLDDEGFVYICDRQIDMIISGGANIYPAEIEEALHRHPAVADAAVFGVPSEEWGERVHAAIQVHVGRHGDGRGSGWVRAAAPGRLQGAARGLVPRRASARRRRQAAQAPVARAVLGRPGSRI